MEAAARRLLGLKSVLHWQRGREKREERERIKTRKKSCPIIQNDAVCVHVNTTIFTMETEAHQRARTSARAD